MKHVLLISASPRKGGNSDTLCDDFAKGALDAGNEVEKIFLNDLEVGFCKACHYCKRNEGACAVKDDMEQVLEKIEWADVLVLATPVYFYAVNAQLKALFDRTVSQWANTRLNNKAYYYIMTAAEDTDTVMDTTLACLRGFAECYEGSVEKGVLYGKGLHEKDAVQQSPYRAQAYEMGKSIN